MTFSFNFTEDQLNQIINTTNNSEWFSALSTVLPTVYITTTNRVAAFLAQTCVECENYTVFVEDLYYSAAALSACWPSLFNATTAAQYADQPELIANLVYANRYGNGDTASGDGWTYRGRGAIQVTFKDNYSACSQQMYGDLTVVENPDLLTQPDGAIKSACWYWSSNNLNQYADLGDITTMTKIINGGYTLLSQRQANYSKFLSILNG
jgi:putative chitinase